MPKAAPLAASLLALTLLIGCEREIVPEPYQPTSAHDAYRHSLSEAGLMQTALGRDWMEASEAALRSPIEVRAPFRETSYVDRSVAFATGYRFSVRRGQRTEVRVEIEPAADWRLFLDLYRLPDERNQELVHVASGGEGDLRLVFEPRKDGDYLLRLQSELLRGGSCTIEIQNVASLDFPVADHDTSAIGSVFGDPREAGRRSHHGVDIFAPRHTEVLATSRARVRRVDLWKLGGRVIWLEDPERNLRLYFAHLQTQDVTEGTWVEAGERIGTVGNSGNARTTPPHLHFGIYVRGEGPIDPAPFLTQPRRGPESVVVDVTQLGRWRRSRGDAPLFGRPARGNDEPLLEMPPGTPLLIEAATGSRYRVALPSGITGYVLERDTEDLSRPLETHTLENALVSRDRPVTDAASVRNLEAGTPVQVLARFGSYAMIDGSPRGEWLPLSLENDTPLTTAP
jgi:murein DD-endopeptidase MepM/ murein hydrolase activator NlpD